jgi:aminoglycoside 6'-N-acetyltransferase
MAHSGYQFRPMSAVDLPLIQRWLKRPHVVEWWGDADKQFNLVSGDLAHPAINQFVVALDGKPFAYLQCYDPHVWPENGFGVLPNGTRGIDQFIGEADMIGRGRGSAFVRAFVDRQLAAGTPCVITDPDPANLRAVRAYEKAGFNKDRLVDMPNGPAILMVRDA